jgi:hypothetical protein
MYDMKIDNFKLKILNNHYSYKLDVMTFLIKLFSSL